MTDRVLEPSNGEKVVEWEGLTEDRVRQMINNAISWQVEGWAMRHPNPKSEGQIPEDRLPPRSGQVGLTEAEVDERIMALVEDWAQEGNSNQIPSHRLLNFKMKGY